MTKDNIDLLKKACERLRVAAVLAHKTTELLGSGPSPVDDAAHEAEVLERVKTVREISDLIIEAVSASKAAEHLLERIAGLKKG